MLHTILNFLASLFSALSRAADASTSDPVSTVDTQSAAPPGWEGAPPYRYLDVSRYQGKITLDGWRKVKAAGYKGVMLKTVSITFWASFPPLRPSCSCWAGLCFTPWAASGWATAQR